MVRRWPEIGCSNKKSSSTQIEEDSLFAQSMIESEAPHPSPPTVGTPLVSTHTNHVN